MKNLIFAIVVLWGLSAVAGTQFVPNEFLAERPLQSKMKSTNTSADFSENVDHLLSVQQNSLENVSTDHKRIHLTQLVTSFSVSKGGLFGLSGLSTSSATTLFWNKKTTVAKNDEVKAFTISADDDELALQMKVDDVVDYLALQNKVKDSSALRDNLVQVMRKGHEIFSDVANLETPNWRVGGYRLDLSISASGVVMPFTKVGESVRLWLEWTKPARSNLGALPDTKVTRFVTKVLDDTEAATAKINMPQFELQNLYVGLGEDVKAGFFGFGSSTFGFVGYVKFVKKPKTELTKIINADDENEDYPVIQEPSENKSLSKFVIIPRREIRNGIQRSLNFAQFFTQKAERTESTHWELSTIRETATITKSGFFGLSSLSTKGVFIFIFNRKKPQSVTPVEFVAAPTYMSLIRLSFITTLGYSIPEIASVELRPNIEFFWK